MVDKGCPNCGTTIHVVEVWRKGYQGQDWKEEQYEKHELADCLRRLRMLIDDIGSRRTV